MGFKNLVNFLKFVCTCLYFGMMFYLVFFIRRRQNGYSFEVNLVPVINSIRELKYLPEIGVFNYLSNIFGNILLFFPLPVVLKTYFKNWKFSRVFLVSLCLSIFIETMQYIFRVGVADIDDVILNTIGSCLGYLFISRLGKTMKS